MNTPDQLLLPQHRKFDSAAFTQQLRNLLAEDQKSMDPRNNIGREFFGNPATSEGCISAVAREIKKNPDMAKEITKTVDLFIEKSMSASGIAEGGTGRESDKMSLLMFMERNRGNFWQKVAVALVAKPEEKAVSDAIRQTENATVMVLKELQSC